MKNFDYVVTDQIGIHARPAGLLVKAAQGFTSDIKLTKAGKTVDAKKLFGVMGLGVKCNDTVTVSCEGEDEAAACDAIKKFFEETL